VNAKNVDSMLRRSPETAPILAACGDRDRGGFATRAAGGSEPPVPALEDALNAFERSMTSTDALDKEAAAHFAERLALYRALVAAINRLSSAISEYKERQIPESLLERGVHFLQVRH
jgi:hypothetical protein